MSKEMIDMKAILFDLTEDQRRAVMAAADEIERVVAAAQHPFGTLALAYVGIKMQQEAE